jgi:CTP:phosphocholine cytidylyltransferase-like protein
MIPIILAAGRGSRLKELTRDRPKPLIFLKIENTTLIEKLLDNLILLGIKKVIIEVGYLKEYIYKYLGNKYQSIEIVYVEVNEWKETNNSYGVSLARDYVDDDFMIIEGDEYFSNPFCDTTLLDIDSENYWIGAKAPITGCLLFCDGQKNIKNLEIVREKEKLAELNDYYKSCGVVIIRKKHKERFFDNLDKFLNEHPDNKKKYFDLCIKENLDNIPMKILELDKQIIWGEIDDQQDLEDLNLVLKNRK